MTGPKRILCLPFSPVLGDSRKNLAGVLALAEKIAAAKTEADVFVLPELALSGYLLESLVSLCALEHSDLEEFAQALTTTGVHRRTEWIIGLPLRERGEIYNAAVVFRDGKVQHIHRKLFLPTYGMFDEGRYFMRGVGFLPYHGNLGKTMIMICEDAWHVELAYAASVAAADAVIVISSSPARGTSEAAEFTSTQKWRNRLQTFAESSGQLYIYCNRSGVEDGILYDGSNFVLDNEARFVAGTPSPVLEQSAVFDILAGTKTHNGLGGKPARQNDVLLAKQILPPIPPIRGPQGDYGSSESR